MRTTGFVLLASVFLLLVSATPSRASEGSDTAAPDASKDVHARIAEWEEAFDKARKEKDVTGLVEAAAVGRGLYQSAEADDDARKDIVKLLGKLLKAHKDDRVTEAGLEALGETGDERADRYIKRYLRQRDKEAFPSTLRAAIKAAGGVRTSSLLRPLLELYEDSENMGVTREVTRALANYRGVRGCEKILDVMLSDLRRCKPNGPGRRPGADRDEAADGDGTGRGEGSGPGARWNTLYSVVPGVLNELTGQSVPTLDDWFLLHKEYKGKLKRLFIEDDEA